MNGNRLSLGIGLSIFLLLPVLNGFPFRDIPKNHWAAPAVKSVVNEGLMKGKSKKRFQGNKALTRYEAAAIFSELLIKIKMLKKENVELKKEIQRRYNNLVQEKFKQHDEFTMHIKKPTPSFIPEKEVIPQKPKFLEKISTLSKGKRLVYSYERLISPLDFGGLDDFRSIIDETIKGNIYSLSIAFNESWDDRKKKSDLLALGFRLTLFRNGSIIQESKSRKYSLYNLQVQDSLTKLNIKPFEVMFYVKDIYRKAGQLKRLLLEVKIYFQAMADKGNNQL
ncbi:S-layer homology domain-containing protein [Candidatus Riflebacteria bacterium]